VNKMSLLSYLSLGHFHALLHYLNDFIMCYPYFGSYTWVLCLSCKHVFLGVEITIWRELVSRMKHIVLTSISICIQGRHLECANVRWHHPGRRPRVFRFE